MKLLTEELWDSMVETVFHTDQVTTTCWHVQRVVYWPVERIVSNVRNSISAEILKL